MKESENIEVHGHSFVIKWINLLEYTGNQSLDINSSPTVTFSFKVKPYKRNIKFGLFTKKHDLNSAGSTFDSSLNNGNNTGRSYRSIFRHANTSVGSFNNNSNTALSSSPPLLHSQSFSAVTTPSSIKKEKKVSLKEKLIKSNMSNLLPLQEIKNNKNFSKNVTISLDQPLYLALVFDNEHNFRKNKLELSFEISTSKVETNSGSNSNLSGYFKNGVLKNNGDTSSTVQESSPIPIQGTPTMAHRDTFDSPAFASASHEPISQSVAANITLARSRRPSMIALNKRSFYIENNTIFQGYVPKNRRNPKSNKQFVTRFFVLDLRSGTLTYYQNNNTKNVKGEVLLKTCVVSADSQRGEIVIDSGFEIWILKPYSWDYDPWIDALSKCIIEETIMEQKIKDDHFAVTDDALISMKKNFAQIQRLTAEAKTITKDETLLMLLGQILELAVDPEKVSIKKAQSIVKGSSDSLSTDLYSSLSMDEFYDAIDEIPRVIMINSEVEDPGFIDNYTEADDDETEDESEDLTSSSNLDSPIKPTFTSSSTFEESDHEYPLPHPPVKRRNDIVASSQNPPSLLSFLRKNVGKDLGSISMPVTSNEPLTILQFLAESLEYSSILNQCLESLQQANSASPESQRKRLALISAFALSQLASQRSKTRCLRKPFNPLLGETFELVNETHNYRFIAEKVEHKPEQVFAIFAEGFGKLQNESNDGLKWEISYTVQPSSKFWGKSIELMNYGTVYCKFLDKSTQSVIETYTWSTPITILKNLIAGERFIEPTGMVEVNCLESQMKTVYEFNSTGGFFKGRSEEANGKLIDQNGKNIGTLNGLWTKELQLLPEKEKIWQVGALVSSCETKYGFTKFASNLNEITEIEKGHIPISDSRLRPDVMFYESGNVDKAEEFKLKLEQTQRDRRLKQEDVIPLYFKKKNSSQYTFVKGKDSYWSKRERKDWHNAPTLW